MRRRTDAARAALERLGRAGVIGIALLAAAAALFASAVVPLRSERTVLRERVEAMQDRYRMNRSGIRDAKPGPAQQLATFYAFFPAAGSSPELLRRIHAAAEEKGLTLAAGDYRIERKPGAKLARYQVTLPVQGSYAQIRGFVGEVLKQVPAAVLEEVALKRDSVESPQLEARIRLTLYLGGA